MTRSFRQYQRGGSSFLRELFRSACFEAGKEGQDTLMRSNRSRFRNRPAWQRRLCLAVVTLFAWTAFLAVPAQVLAHSSLQKPQGVRSLTSAEMQKMRGSQGTSHYTSLAPESGSAFPWEASVGGTNTGNGNHLSQVPLVSWTARGGMPVAFTLSHNSQG
ncbi:MAG: repeat-containing protein, partial [Chthonomonadales bacterium]|nr:repeat-containing protein [Chthonomonadales bacterium]